MFLDTECQPLFCEKERCWLVGHLEGRQSFWINPFRIANSNSVSVCNIELQLSCAYTIPNTSAGADPASWFRGAISVKFGSQVS